MHDNDFIFPDDLDNVYQNLGFAKVEKKSEGNEDVYTYDFQDFGVLLQLKDDGEFFQYKIVKMRNRTMERLESIHEWYMNEINSIEESKATTHTL